MTYTLDIKQKNKVRKIPDTLIYETINGKNYYYKGYQKVLNKKETLESIIGYGLFQWMIIDAIIMHLKLNLPKHYKTLGGEGGFHLGHGDNLSIDIAILDKKDIDFANIQNKYLHFAPKAVIEVDTKVDEFNIEYTMTKTQKMLDFGVEQIVWVLTNSKKIIVARPNVPWLTVNWHDDIEILGITTNLQHLLENEGFTNF
jgi:hypothetical protein